MGIVAFKFWLEPEVILMRSMVLVRGLGGSPEKKETELNERIAEHEKDGWEVADVQIIPPAFGSQAIIVLRLAKGSD